MKNIFKSVGFAAVVAMTVGAVKADVSADQIAAAQKAAIEAAKAQAKENPELAKQIEAAQKAMQDPEMQKKIAAAQKAAMETPEYKKQLELTAEYQKAVAAGDNEKAQKIQAEMAENAKKMAEAVQKAAK